MRRNVLAGAFLVAIAVGGILALSQTETSEAQGPPTFSLPSQAVLVSPGVWSLGTTVINGRIAEGFAIATHKNGHTKGKPGGGGGEPTDPVASCYSFLGNGARWKGEGSGNFLFQPLGSGLDAPTSLATLRDQALEQWDRSAGFNSINGGRLWITGDQVLYADATAADLDYVSEVYFADLGTGGTIAYTLVWGYFRGPPSGRELISWDMVFSTNYAWAMDGSDGAMDFENIAAHEAGHAVGMGHTDTSSDCVDQTMYPTADFGETNKRELGVGDIAGVIDLYN